MNYTTAIFLIRSDIRAVKVSYDVHGDGKGVEPFIMFKTADPSVAVGEYVVIPTDTRHGMTVCRVEEVDCEVDYSSKVPVGWLVGVVDRTVYDTILKHEDEAVTKIKSAEKRRMQDELKAKLIADNPDLQMLTAVDITPALGGPAG